MRRRLLPSPSMVVDAAGTLNDVVAHEMGHVLGFGTVWEQKSLLKQGGSSNPTFSGPGAMEEYRVLRGGGRRRRVSVENTAGPGTRDVHWRETVFRNELMSGFISAPGNPLSRLTAASLGDLGYEVDVDAGEPFTLPNLFALAEEGSLVPRAAPIDGGVVLPAMPIVLPPTASGRARGNADVVGEGGKSGDRPGPGVIRRPEAVVLGEESLVPDRNVVRPAPNRFTHELLVDEPYRLDRPEPSTDTDGVLPARTKVVLLVERRDRCRVVDGRGLYVEVRRSSLRRLPDG
jgi:Leishmanolysin